MNLWSRIRWPALIAVAAAAAIATNVALLDVAERRDDPVGKLSRRVLIATTDRDPPLTIGGGAGPPLTRTTGTGDDSDDETDAREPGETDDD